MKVLGCLFALFTACRAGIIGVGNAGYGGSYSSGNHVDRVWGHADGGSNRLHSSVSSPTVIKVIHNSEGSTAGYGGPSGDFDGDFNGGYGGVKNVKIIKLISYAADGQKPNNHGDNDEFYSGHDSKVKIIKVIHDEGQTIGGYGRFSGSLGGDRRGHNSANAGLTSSRDGYSSYGSDSASNVKIIKVINSGSNIGARLGNIAANAIWD